jgi:hypothetical protein
MSQYGLRMLVEMSKVSSPIQAPIELVDGALGATPIHL